MKIRRFITRLLLIAVFISMVEISFCENLYASSYSLDRYRDLEKILIKVETARHTENILQTLINSRFRDNGGFPYSKEQIGVWVTDILKEQIKTSTEIKTVLTSESDPLYPPEKNLDKLYLRIRLEYWEKSAFSPKLNNNIMAVSINSTRFYARYEGGEDFKITPSQKETPLLLVSASDDKGELEINVKDHLQELLKKYLTAYINCANGGNCKDLK